MILEFATVQKITHPDVPVCNSTIPKAIGAAAWDNDDLAKTNDSAKLIQLKVMDLTMFLIFRLDRKP